MNYLGFRSDRRFTQQTQGQAQASAQLGQLFPIILGSLKSRKVHKMMVSTNHLAATYKLFIKRIRHRAGVAANARHFSFHLVKK